MTKVKICGLRRIEDAAWANALLPDYIGFIFAKSKRQVTAKQAAETASRLDTRIKTVGVFVNATQSEIDDVLSTCPLDVLQLHGEEAPAFCAQQSISVWKAFRIADKTDFDKTNAYHADAFLFDGYSAKAHGGVGERFNWQWLDAYKGSTPMVIAGGIDEHNATEAIRIAKPFAVDISSAVETDGFKDAAKVERFIRKVRETK